MKKNAARRVVVGIVAMVCAATAIVLVTKVATCVSGEVIRACPAPYGVSVISRFDDAPPALARALTDRVGEIAPVGGKFNPTDVHIIGVTGKSRRLIFIWSLGNRWVVATERGGVGYNNPIFAFDVASDGPSAAFVEERVTFPESLCATASSLLAVGN
jgi:hypothetical protein